MSKRYSIVTLCAFLLGLTLMVQAQDDPAPTQSVDSAVSTLLAQTQQAPTQINMTQTVQAALEQVLTATAQAATPAPFDAANAEAVGTTEIDLLAGPGNTGVYLAPDGEKFVYRDDDQLCLDAEDAEPTCVLLPEPLDRTLNPETILWSPDSRYVTFTENFFEYFVDSDIWVWDTTRDSVTNLTDDGPYRLDFNDERWEGIDAASTWLPDGRIVFLRYSRVGDTNPPAEIYAIQPDGSNLEKLGTLENSDDFGAYALSASQDHLYYNYFLGSENTKNGAWVSELDGSNSEQIFASEEGYAPSSVTVSPDERYLLINLPIDGIAFDTEQSRVRLIDLESHDLLPIDPEFFVVGAGWSPDGSTLAYIVNNPIRVNETENGLYVTDTPGEGGRLLLEGQFNIATPRLQQPIIWGENNTILLSRSPEPGIVLVELGSQ